MRGGVLVLRPQPGADETAARALGLGLEPVVAPLFTVAPVPWQPPDARLFDAVLLTSAHAARHARAPALFDLPCYAVGEATAAAAAAAGFRNVAAGTADGAAVAAAMARAGVARALHLCGHDHLRVGHPRIAFERRVVYAAEAVEALPRGAAAALRDGALVLIHSPRAGALFARLADAAGIPRGGVAIAAISEAAACACGRGWRILAVAARPRDEALLELGAKLCQNESRRSEDEADGL